MDGPRIIPWPEDRLPPQDLDAERAILGGVLKDLSWWPAIAAVLSPEDFYRDAHQILFRTIRARVEADEPLDLILLRDEMVRRGNWEKIGGDDGIAELMEKGSVAYVDQYVHVVREKSRLRGLIEAGQELVDGCYSGFHTPDDLIDRVQRRIESSMFGTGFEEPTTGHPWPDPPSPDAWHGLAGEVVGLIAPHTEADPMAILVQFLVAFGNLVGRSPHWQVEATRHSGNLFTCLVGNSSKARKGTSWDHVLRLLSSIDPTWGKDRIGAGLSSGEGLIWSVRDPITRRDPIKAAGVITGYADTEFDPGVPDKRLLVVEPEFAGALGVMSREGNTLSGILRQAWDSGNLRTMTTGRQQSPARSTGAHVSIVGHITAEELQRRLSQTDVSNGFANRFLWVCARRVRSLPHGGRIQRVDFGEVIRRLAEVVAVVSEAETLWVRDEEADRLWESVYPRLSEPRPGLLGSVTSRAEAQAMRLAFLYALLDRSPVIRLTHLRAGLAVWSYCNASASYIFGDSLGDPPAEKLLEAIRSAGEDGLSRRNISVVVFSRNKSSDEIGHILGRLERAGLVTRFTQPTQGRPAEVWKATSFV